MSTTLEPPGAPAAAAPAIKGAAVRRGDRVFVGLSRGAGILILVTMAAIAVFLIWKAIPSLQANTANFFTATEGAGAPGGSTVVLIWSDHRGVGAGAGAAGRESHRPCRH